MILSRHFVFLHVPKTGGNFVRVLLEQYAPSDWQVQRHVDHATVADIPPSHAHLPRIAFVRNPFSWYLSWYQFQVRTRDPFFLAISEEGRLPFAESLRRALRSNEALAKGEGPYTQTLRLMLGRDLAGIRIGRIEHMREDLERLLSEIVPLPAAMVAAIRTLPPQNTSEHAHWSTYYDAELRQLIAEKDKEAFAYLGYGWEEPEV